MFSGTVFESAFDNRTHRKLYSESWEEMVKLLTTLSERPGYKPVRGEFKKGSSLISPAVYEDGTTRSNTNVIKWGRWAALDIDDYDGSFEDAYEKYKNYEHVCYSTASSSLEHPKFRILFPLTSDINKEKIKHFWYALNKEFGEDGDPQTKDMSRMYYVPAQYPDAYNFFIHNKGEWIDVEKLLVKHKWVDRGVSFLDRLPDTVKKELLNRRKDQMTNTKVSWTTWDTCPFVNKKIVAEYKTISSTGWYHKMYQLMVSIAGNAVKRKYPITPGEIARICKEIDNETGGWYANRPLEKEAARAIEFVYSQSFHME